MSDLSDALRKSGHADLADQLEAKLQGSADAPEGPKAEKPAPPKSPEETMGEGLLEALNRSVTPWHNLVAGV